MMSSREVITSFRKIAAICASMVLQEFPRRAAIAELQRASHACAIVKPELVEFWIRGRDIPVEATE